MSLPLLLLPLPRTMEEMVAFVHTVTAATSTPNPRRDNK